MTPVPLLEQSLHVSVHLVQGGFLCFGSEQGHGRRYVDDYLALGRVVLGLVLGVEVKKMIADGKDFAETKKTVQVGR